MWIGIVVSVVAVLAITILWILLDFKRQAAKAIVFLNDVKAIQPDPKPETITRQPSASGSWDQPSVATIADDLRRRGFEPVGVFELVEVPGIEVYPMIHKSGTCFAIISRLTGPDTVWFGLGGLESNGTVIELASTPLVAGPPVRPGKESKYVTRYKPELAMFTFAKMCGGRTMLQLTPEKLMEHLDEEWKASFAFQKERMAVAGVPGTGEE